MNMFYKKETIPLLPGRTYKGWSKYWNAGSGIFILLFLTVNFHKYVTNPSLTIFLLLASIILPLIIAWRWHPLIKETYISASDIKITYDTHKVETFPLSECIWFLQQISSSAIGSAYTYKLYLFYAPEKNKLSGTEEEDGFAVRIERSMPVLIARIPETIVGFVKKVETLSGINIPVSFENEQMSEDYKSGKFVKLRRK